MSAWAWAIVAWVVIVLEFRLSAWNLKSPYNGYGMTEAVARRQTELPMARRVLVPMLISAAERLIPRLRRQRLVALYLPIKWAMLWAALLTIAGHFGNGAALGMALAVPLLTHFDYWSWIPELGSFAAMLGGDPILAVLWIVLHALSRVETMPVAALVFALRTGDLATSVLIALAGGATALAVRLWHGERKLYFPRVTLKKNLCDLREVFKNRPFYTSHIFIAATLTVLTLLSAIGQPTGLAAVALVGAGWFNGRAAETRVFMPCVLWVVSHAIT
jgi:hypothetical protein